MSGCGDPLIVTDWSCGSSRECEICLSNLLPNYTTMLYTYTVPTKRGPLSVYQHRHNINSALSLCISKQMPTVEVCKYESLCFRNVKWKKVSSLLLLILIRFYISFFLAVLRNIRGTTVMAP
jgi:hypothetical protein